MVEDVRACVPTSRFQTSKGRVCFIDSWRYIFTTHNQQQPQFYSGAMNLYSYHTWGEIRAKKLIGWQRELMPEVSFTIDFFTVRIWLWWGKGQESNSFFRLCSIAVSSSPPDHVLTARFKSWGEINTDLSHKCRKEASLRPFQTFESLFYFSCSLNLNRECMRKIVDWHWQRVYYTITFPVPPSWRLKDQKIGASFLE